MRFVMIMLKVHLDSVMVTPPRSPSQLDGNSEPQPKKTRQSTRLRRLTLRSLDQPRPTVTVDPTTGRASGQEK